jgi:SAM-dependent methyltransferase
VKLNLGSGAYPLDDFENLDAENGWRFEDGLGQYGDESVEGCSISHALMYVELKDWPFVFSEIARVLEPGGVVRITEDATDDFKSSRYGGFEGAVTLTTRDLVRAHLEIAGLRVEDVSPRHSFFRDDSLLQTWHGFPPKTFFCEGVKEDGSAGDRATTMSPPPDLSPRASAER